MRCSILEETLGRFQTGSSDPAEVLVGLNNVFVVLNASARACPATATLSDRIEAVARTGEHRRALGLILIRCLGVYGAIPETEVEVGLFFRRRALALFEQAIPDLMEQFRVGEEKQTIDKIEKLRGVQRHCEELLSVFCNLPSDPKEFVSRRQEVLQRLNNKFLKAYLNPYGFAQMSNTVRRMFNGICDILETTDTSFGKKLESFFDDVDREIKETRDRSDFLFTMAFKPFLDRCRETLGTIDNESAGRFKCHLHPRRSGSIERRYPLHDPDRLLRIKIPLVNDGPGEAVDTTALVVSGSDKVLVSSELMELGAIPPGEFALVFNMLVGQPISEVPLIVELSWQTARGSERFVNSFETIILAQRAGIDWDYYQTAEPYSTEVAHGEEFVGRRAKVLALLNRVRRVHMQSSYITGQKRVGKTSLAFAVQEALKREAMPDHPIEVIYLEYGEYARRDADDTVRALGEAIAVQLLKHLPPDLQPRALDFRGSLAPLNQIAQALKTAAPKRRFLIILDEFDEIPPEMYRFGALAETFFSNLRTLSAKPNFAVILVGGENMPFIIGAQGDQLNKFVREPLDYFSRGEEWEDFSELVRQSHHSPLNWHESAISKVFNYTNGHPFYTKLLCATVFQNAVSDRDADVTVDEVQKASMALVEMLDTNAFAHFWKDGIFSGREEAEAVALKRCRVLVAIARVRRLELPITADAIVQNRGLGLANSEIVPLLEDFCRREVLRERAGIYEFVLPMFEQWLIAKGMSKLIPDTLGDEMADAITKAEDQAFVTTPEITALVQRWSLYRGHQITPEHVRGWLSQRNSFREQRILFKLLQNVKFLGEEEVREKLRLAHSIVKKYATAFTPETRVHRRWDIIVTYVDGPGKSGSRYADTYAEENLLSTSCIMESANFAQLACEFEERRKINGVVVIDDVAATGKSLGENIGRFIEANATFLRERNITLVVVTLIATREADVHLREKLKHTNVDIDFRTTEILQDKHFAFRDGNGIWSDREEADRARELVREIGRGLDTEQPLGFGDLGLLLVFYNNCPNNSLPILHQKGKSWHPIFPRAKN